MKYECENNTMLKTLLGGIKQDVDFSYANLHGVDFSCVDFSCADLRGTQF